MNPVHRMILLFGSDFHAILFLMKSILLLLTGILLLFTACPDSTSSPVSGDSTTLELHYVGPSSNLRVVYAAWLEDAEGNNIQNLYICNYVVGIGTSLLGDGLPVWSTTKYPQNGQIDGVTGASVQGEMTVARGLEAEMNQQVRICFEIDRSTNGNTYFTDRPSFLYRSGLIDLSNLSTGDEYPLILYAWMGNDTDHSTYGQIPTQNIPGYEAYKLMTDLSYIENHDDMVSSLNVTFTLPASP